MPGNAGGEVTKVVEVTVISQLGDGLAGDPAISGAIGARLLRMQ